MIYFQADSPMDSVRETAGIGILSDVNNVRFLPDIRPVGLLVCS